MAHDHTAHQEHGSIFSRIIAPFLWLFFITALEFIIALYIKTDETKLIWSTVFVLMTLVKAFFIVAYFMHLKFEKVGLKWSIVAPMVFVLYLILLLVLEGRYMYHSLWN